MSDYVDSGEDATVAGRDRADEDGADTLPMHENRTEAGQQIEPGTEEFEDVDQVYPPAPHFLIKGEGPPDTTSYRVLRHLAVVSVISFAAIWGLLAREGLVALNTYSGRSVEPTIWAQAVGCLVIGWTVANREDLETWYPPAYIALGTGFCGSLTTFSSWILHVFQAYGDQLHYDRHGLHNVMDALTQTALTIGMSLISLYAGKALKSVLPVKPLLHHLERISTRRAMQNKRASTSKAEADEASGKVIPLTEQSRAPYTILPDLCSVMAGVLLWAGAAILCGTYAPYRHVTYAVVLSPPGAILRWYLSRLNSYQRSKHFPYWPLGTLAASLIATAVLSAVFVGQRVGRISGSPTSLGAHTVDACNALYGVQEGFCGCLSTISTFAVELDTLKPRRRAVGYALGSYVLGIVICVLVVGTPWWTIGMDGSCVGVTV